MKRTVTKEDLDLNPELVEKGVEVGDEIDVPENGGNEDIPAEDGPGPGAPPPPPPPPPPKP